MTSFEVPEIAPKPKFTISPDIIKQAWLQSGAEGEAPDWFGAGLTDVLQSYFEKPGKQVSLPAKERNRFYKKVGDASQVLRDAISDLPDRIEWELQQTYTCYEPENVEDILTGDNEGLSYGEYELECLTVALETLQAMIAEARNDYKPEMGRPQQNENLEQTIVKLAALFEQATGEAVVSGYSYVESNEKQPYQSPFISFVTALLWAHNKREFPSNPTIGEAARKALGLRK